MASIAGRITGGGDSMKTVISNVTTNCDNVDNAIESGCQGAVFALTAECRMVSSLNGQLADTDDDRDRTTANIVGASIGAATLGTIGGIATYKNIKAANRKKFTEAEKEFMDNVGSHIYCFVGADEAGTYGDLIQLSLD